MKQNAKQTLQNIQHSQTSKTQKKIKLHSHLLSECGCPDVTSLALFSLWRYSDWSEHPGGCRVYHILPLDRKAIVSHDQRTLWNPCIHLLIQFVLLELLLCYLVAGLGEAEKKDREVLLNSVSLSVKTGGTTDMPTSEPPQPALHTYSTLTHCLTHSFTP